MTLHVLLVANKTWECEPIVGVLAGKRPKPTSLSLDGVPFYPNMLPDAKAKEWKPGSGPPPAACVDAPTPRLRLVSKVSSYVKQEGDFYAREASTYEKREGDFYALETSRMEVELWSIEEWMTHSALRSSSSSSDKMERALPTIRANAFRSYDKGQVAARSPDLVIALGTAGMPSNEVVNGCVVVGSRVFVSDPFSDDPKAREARHSDMAGIDRMLDLAETGLPLDTKIPGVARAEDDRLTKDVFRRIPDAARFAELCFLAPPVHPATPLRIFAGSGFAALSTVNVIDYDDYVWTDALTRERFGKEIHRREIGSMESTHGLIRATWPGAGFLYVSGITDRVPSFNQEVTPRVYAQNFACAHNMGVTAAFLLPALFDLHREGKLLAAPPAPLSAHG